MLVQCFHHVPPILIAVVNFYLPVFVANKLLDINAALASHAKHDAALVFEGSLINGRLFDFEVLALLGLLRAHIVLGLDGLKEFLHILVSGHRKLKNVALKESA